MRTKQNGFLVREGIPVVPKQKKKNFDVDFSFKFFFYLIVCERQAEQIVRNKCVKNKITSFSS